MGAIACAGSRCAQSTEGRQKGKGRQRSIGTRARSGRPGAWRPEGAPLVATLGTGGRGWARRVGESGQKSSNREPGVANLRANAWPVELKFDPDSGTHPGEKPAAVSGPGLSAALESACQNRPPGRNSARLAAANIAQLVEQRFRKARVAGSSPAVGSSLLRPRKPVLSPRESAAEGPAARSV